MFQASSVHLQEDTIVYMQHMVLSQFVVACRYTAWVLTHLQEDTVVYMQHMLLSLSTRVRGGLSVHSLSSQSSCVPTGHHELS